MLMAVFPLFMTNKYYEIQDDKMYFMIFATSACLVVAALIGAVGFFNESEAEARGSKRKSTVSDAQDKKSSGIREFIRGLSAADRFAAAFFIVLIIATCTSGWLYEAFWGNMGRYQGLYLWIFYFMGYMMISRFYKPRKWHIDIFMAAGLMVCAWGVMDFFYKSPFGWQEHARDYAEFDFSSSIGNVNLLTAFEGMILNISSALFIGEDFCICDNDKKVSEKNKGNNSGKCNIVSMLRAGLYMITAFTAVLGLMSGFSDNAIISLGAAVALLPFYAFKDRRGVIKYLALLTVYAGGFVLMGGLIASGVKTVSRQHWGVLLELCTDYADRMRLIFTVLAVLLIPALLLYRITEKRVAALDKNAEERDERSFDKRLAVALRTIWALALIAAGVFILYILYDANTGGHPDRYAPYSNYLIFSDTWGTRRGYNWKLAFGYFKDFPILKKLFGAGPETYPIYTYTYDYYNMIHAFDEIYDSPHNEWIQYLFTTGIVGFICYYGWTAASIINGFRAGLKPENNDGKNKKGISVLQGTGLESAAAALAFGIITYALVSFVNISAPCLTPMVILCMGITAAMERCRRENAL